MTQDLEKILEEITRKTPEEQWLKNSEWMHYPEMDALKESLAKTPYGEKFDGQLQSLGNGGRAVSVFDLARWLVMRSLQTRNPKQAIDELKHYCTATEVEVYEVMLLSDVLIQDEDCRNFEFCNGVRFVEGISFPNVWFEWEVEKHNSAGFKSSHIDGILIAPYNHPIFHESIYAPCPDMVVKVHPTNQAGSSSREICDIDVATNGIPLKDATHDWLLSCLKAV